MQISMLLTLVVLNGCVASINPVIPESAADIDPRLIVSCEEVPGSDRAIVSRADNTVKRIGRGSQAFQKEI